MKLATTTGEVQLFAPTMAEALEIYKGTGFRYLDYSFYDVLALPNCPFMTDAWKEDILKTKEKAEELGFTFVQAHAPNCTIIGEGSDVGLASTIRSIEACGMLGIHNMVIHTASSSLYRYPQDRKGYYDGNRPFLTALIPYMEKYDVSILLENTCAQHTNGTYFPITGEDLVDMAEDLNHPLFGVMWDVGHAHIQGLDHHDELVTMSKYLKALHVHDNNGEKDQHLIPYLGTANFDSLMRGIIDSGYQGYFTFESNNLITYNMRKRFKDENSRLYHPTKEVKRAAIALMYQIGKSMLEAYGLFEE